MDSMLDEKLSEGQAASLEEQFEKLAREAGLSPSPPTSKMPSRAPLATIHRLADWRYVAFVGSLVAVSIGIAAWWWSSSVDTAMMAPSDDPAPLTQATPEAAAPKEVAPTAVVLSSELAQQFQPMAGDLAALRQTVEQLNERQEQLVRDNENLASQLKASREEMARNNSIIDQIKANQIQMARESQTLTERLNASQEQLARVIAKAPEPKVMAEEPKVMPEEPKVSPEDPKVMPEIPLPRPRPSANVAQTQKPAPIPTRSQPSTPQPLAWPWSVR